jgi:NADH:ubiquinone oxidoreductase subunit 5 (subunit L)/multisubunit Na+/H+ antiporter MnhA subunit
MEGPIPVSSLIHALTLVTVGIILIGFVWHFIDVWFSFFIYTLF